MEEGEILEEEAVTLEIQEEAAETLLRHTTNYQGNSPPFSKETDANQKDSSRSGTSIGASISSLHKS